MIEFFQVLEWWILSWQSKILQ